jgi:citrate lyase gamma subunit
LLVLLYIFFVVIFLVGLLLALVEVDKKGMLTTSLRGRVVEVNKKGMPTTSLRGRVVEVDKKGMLTTSLRGREVEVIILKVQNIPFFNSSI